MPDLSTAPFHLTPAQTGWVEDSLAALTPDQRLAQLFNLNCDPADADQCAAIARFGPGGITLRPSADSAASRAAIAAMNDAAPLPLLVAADIEGGLMSIRGGTEFPNPLALAAVDDPDLTAAVAAEMAAEARAHGVNWAFSPVVDINAAFRSPIVATRSFGADPDRIARHALAQATAFQAAGIAATVKHWPGEGYDDRDQHLVTTQVPLSLDDWRASFGRLYGDAIAAGVLSVMAGHIGFAAGAGTVGVEAYRPASVSSPLLQGLLRGELGFNGVIVSDATPMAGLGAWAPRQTCLPEIIQNGCDVILFATDLGADMHILQAALADGRLTDARVDAALRRLLALKARLGLASAGAAAATSARTRDATPAPAVAAAPYAALAAAPAAARAIARAPTLVKDTKGLLPLSPDRHRRILVMSSGIVLPFLPQPMPFALPAMLAKAGFEVTDHQPGQGQSPDDFDLVLILSGDESLLTRGRIFFDWLGLTGNFIAAMQRDWHTTPHLMISFGHPYHLYDAPRVPAYVNAYTATPAMQAAVLDCLLGRQPWNRQNPVDPFCGQGDAVY